MADAFGDITDSSNPFNVAGISDEDRALLQYLRAAKAATRIDVVATCTTDHPSGPTRHLQLGTNGTGLAIDCRKRTRGRDIHRAVFDLFVPIETLLYELIYAGASYNIKAGRRVDPYAVADHHDHVHVAVDRGVLVRWPRLSPPAPAPLPTTLEVDVQIRSEHIEMPLDAQGRGNVTVPWPIDTIIGFLPHSEVRPNVDGRYDAPANSVTFTPDGTGTVVVVQQGTPLGKAHVWLRVAA